MTALQGNSSNMFFFPLALWPNASASLLILRFLDHTYRHTTVGRTPQHVSGHRPTP